MTLSKVSRLSLLQLVTQSLSQSVSQLEKGGIGTLTLPHTKPQQGAAGEVVPRQLHRYRRRRGRFGRRGRGRGRRGQSGAVSAGRAVALRERGARAAVPVQLHAVVLDLGRRPPDRLRLAHLRLLRLARRRRGHLQKGKTDLVSGDFAWCSAKTKYGFQFGRILVQVLFDHIALAVQEFGPGRDRSEMQLSCRLMIGCSQGMLV